jgi:thiol-disulfide isomerase/thioredoxin
MVEKWLRGLVYFAVISLCLVRVHSYWSSDQPKAKPTAQSLAARLVGSKLDLKESNGGIAAKATILIAMTTSCVYCRASAPFYTKLLGKVRAFAGNVRTIALMPENKQAAVGYLQDSLLLRFDDVTQRVPGFATAATPTLLVADEQGVVKAAWVGLLKPAAEDEVIKTVCGVAGIDSGRCYIR